MEIQINKPKELYTSLYFNLINQLNAEKKMEIKFKAKKKRIGGSYAVIVPKGIADLLNPDIEYIFQIKEVQNDESVSKNLS
jgi:hypothetical protein